MSFSSRTQKSIANSFAGIFQQTLTILSNMVVRAVFIRVLTNEFLGVNGLFSNILTILSLAELGVGEAIIFNMYKPLAEKNISKVKQLMHLYATAYRLIGCSVAVIGLSVVPFLDSLVKNKPEHPYLLQNFTLIYLLFLSNTVLSYFFAYKRSIIIADQKGYIANNYYSVTTAVKSVLQIGFLLLTKDFILFLIIQVLVTFSNNFAISKKSDSLYPYLKDKDPSRLDKNERKGIFKNIRALMIYKVGSVALDGSDNIIISATVGLAAVGRLSNYTLIISSMAMILRQVTKSISASIGNLVATGSQEKQFFVFKSINLLSFLLFGSCSILIFVLINPFIVIWTGKESSLLSTSIALIITFNFFILGMMDTIWTYRTTMGLFVHGKYRPLISAIVNIGVSITLAKYFGLPGVLLGTTITRVVTNVWFDPYIVFKHGFKRSVIPYYLRYLGYLGVLLIVGGLAYYTCSFLPDSGIFALIAKFAVSTLIVFSFFFIIFFRTEEFQYLYKSLKSNLLKMKKT